MNMVRHQAVAEHLQLIDLLPLLKVCQVVLEITAFDEHRLAVMPALDNMMGKTGHNYLGPSWHKHLLACKPQNPFCRPATNITEAWRRLIVTQTSSESLNKP